MTWANSRQYCEDNGGQLVVITSEEKQNYLASKCNDISCWIGLREVDGGDGNWQWIDGIVFLHLYHTVEFNDYYLFTQFVNSSLKFEFPIIIFY
jgi:hypothetical protein